MTFDTQKTYRELGDKKLGDADYVLQDGIVYVWSESNVDYEPMMQGEQLLISETQYRRLRDRYGPVPPLDSGREIKAKYPFQVMIDYTNHRGERRKRRITPILIDYRSTPFHPETQWILHAHDIDKGELRDFAMKDIHSWEPYDAVSA